ncbi:sulfatase-like hydrolase/transferase [Clostridium botulinum]|nr:sulfatase-like hydrolase/transferase [Clostridium botulinum]
MKILFLDLDTLRADHLGCYDYHRNTSPNIDSIAEDGVRFNNYYCSDAPCLPSRTALMSGKFGIHTGVVNHGGLAADFRLMGAKRCARDTLAEESLPAFLRKQGFRTISISPFAERHSSWNFYAGFTEMYNTGKRGRESAEEITPP